MSLRASDCEGDWKVCRQERDQAAHPLARAGVAVWQHGAGMVGTFALLLLFFLLCLGRICRAFGKGQVVGDGWDGHSGARPALWGWVVVQVLEPQQVQSIWGELCPLPFQNKPTHVTFTRCQPRAGSCTHGSLGTGEGRRRNKDGGSGGRDKTFPGHLGKDALSPCPLSQGCPQQLCS